jgi:hypothetical protein
MPPTLAVPPPRSIVVGVPTAAMRLVNRRRADRHVEKCSGRNNREVATSRNGHLPHVCCSPKQLLNHPL